MGPINDRLQALNKALFRLSESLELFSKEKQHIDPVRYNQERDSVIKRFEFSIDLFWKNLKDLLMTVHGIELASPKSIFRECLGQQVITDTEFTICIDMINDRNNTAHCYNEELAEEIAQHIKKYYTILSTITKQLHDQT